MTGVGFYLAGVGTWVAKLVLKEFYLTGVGTWVELLKTFYLAGVGTYVPFSYTTFFVKFINSGYLVACFSFYANAGAITFS